MSRSTLYTFGPDGQATVHAEYPNAWGYAIPIWQRLARKYLPDLAGFFLEPQASRKIWALHDDPRLESWERICLLATFDRFIVRKGDFPKLIEAFRTFDSRYRFTDPGKACHYGRMAADIEVMPAEVVAVGWQCTSVSEDLWEVEDEHKCPACGGMHSSGDSRPYNLNSDTGHEDLFSVPDPGKPA